MRWVLLVILLAPGASAASQVHLTYTGESYAVTYRGSEVFVSTANASHASHRAEDVGGGWKRADLALGAGLTSYSIGDERYEADPPPAAHETTRVVFVADMGVGENASRIARAIANASPDLVLIGGDLSYAHGDLATWDAWFDLVEPFAAVALMMPAFGNHEHYCAKGATSFSRCDEESARWDQHFALPNGAKRYYAFDWGPLRVTTLDTEAYIDAENERATDPEDQEAFLRDSLAGDEDRWDLVMFHRPLRTTLERAGAALPQDDAARLAGLLGGSDLVLQAHVHAYERSRPDDAGTLFVTSGGGGRELYETWRPEEPWLAVRASVHHFVVLDVSPGRIWARAIDVANETFDSFTIEREVPASLRPPSPPTPTATPSPTPAASPPTAASTPTAASPPSSVTPSPPATAPPTSAPQGPTESNATPLSPWMLVAALALTAWRRRAEPPSRG